MVECNHTLVVRPMNDSGSCDPSGDPAPDSDDSLRAVFDCVNDGIFVCDAATGRFIDVNQPACKMFGSTRAELLGKEIEALWSGTPPCDQHATMHKVEKALGGAPQLFEWQCRAKDGHLFWSEISIHGATRHGIAVVLAIVRDMTERKRAAAELRLLARSDALTGLANRTAFLECVEQAIATACAKFAILRIDLDRFQDVNGTLGRSAGDQLLRAVAERIGGVMRKRAFLARLGGDAFGIVLYRRGPGRAAQAARELLDAAAAPFPVAGRECQISFSIGIACCKSDTADAGTLLTHADMALYRAKSQGRGTFQFFSAEMDGQARARVFMTAELRDAAASGQLHLAYQPQARVSGEITGFEALIRWQHPRLGEVKPAVFIPLAEASRLIMPIGEWVLRQACREAASWPRPLHICIDLSPVQFCRDDLPDLVHTVLLQTGLEASRLELEITDRVLIADFPRAVSILRRLKALGVGIALDHFGIGYSSLAYLQSFRFDKIKIDCSFLSNLERNPRSATIIHAVIALGKGLGVPVTAEGVESARQLAFLSKEDCDGVQGNLIGRPLPIKHYIALIGRRDPVFSSDPVDAGPRIATVPGTAIDTSFSGTEFDRQMSAAGQIRG